MTEKIDVKINVQENNCVDGIIILLSSELYELIKEDKIYLNQLFDNVIENIEIMKDDV